MDAQLAARLLDGNEYGNEGSRELFSQMKASGLVAVFGASDDLMEFRGAVDDELGAYGGTTAYFTPSGMLANECDNDRCPYFQRERERAMSVDAIWCENGFAWSYDTEIPHATFIVSEGGESYCRGIVFALSDASATES